MKVVRGIISDTLLLWAVKVLPWGSPDRVDLLLTLRDYLKRSVERNQAEIRRREPVVQPSAFLPKLARGRKGRW